MTPRDLLLAGLELYGRHEPSCGVVEDAWPAKWSEFADHVRCTCGLAQWRAQVIELIEQQPRFTVRKRPDFYATEDP